MSPAHVLEVCGILASKAIPGAVKSPARWWRTALLATCQGPGSSRTMDRHLARLLLAAVSHARHGVARRLVAARTRAGLTRAQLARAVGRPLSFVARAERGQARVDVEYLQRVRALGRG